MNYPSDRVRVPRQSAGDFAMPVCDQADQADQVGLGSIANIPVTVTRYVAIARLGKQGKDR